MLGRRRWNTDHWFLIALCPDCAIFAWIALHALVGKTPSAGRGNPLLPSCEPIRKPLASHRPRLVSLGSLANNVQTHQHKLHFKTLRCASISTTFYPFSLTLCFNATASEQTIWKSWISRNSPSRKVLFVGPLSNLLLLMESAGRTQYYWIWILVTCQWPFFFGLYVPWAMAPRSCNAHISFNLTLILARTTQLPALGAITQKCNTFFFSCHFILLPSILKALFSVFDHKGPILPVQAGNFSYFGSFAIWQKNTLLLNYHWLSIMK